MQTKSLKGRDFISTLEFTKEELESMLELAAVLKADTASGRDHPLLLRKTLFIILPTIWILKRFTPLLLKVKRKPILQKECLMLLVYWPEWAMASP